MLRRSAASIVLIASVTAGCRHSIRTYRVDGERRTMTREQGRYSKRALREVRRRDTELRRGGVETLERLGILCTEFDEVIASAPEPKYGLTYSAQSLLDAKRRATCEDHQAHQRRATLQATVHDVGLVECIVEDYVVLGMEMDGLIAKQANGVYVAVLFRCTNHAMETVILRAQDAALVDGNGRRYAVDADGSTYYAREIDGRRYPLPWTLEHFPAVQTRSVAVFDVPGELQDDHDARFVIFERDFPLTMPVLENGASATR